MKYKKKLQRIQKSKTFTPEKIVNEMVKGKTVSPLVKKIWQLEKY